MSGYVYILESDHLPGWCKVGRTTRDPAQRANELSTGVPGTLSVFSALEVDDPEVAERWAHDVLARYRHQSGDEWFHLPAADAERIIFSRTGRNKANRKRLAWALWLAAIAAVIAFN